MRTLAALGITAALASAAAADDAKRKGAPDKFAQAAGDAFREATAADQAGDLRAALGLYKKAYSISPHPSTIYNIADVQRRMKEHGDALQSYRTYLVLAPEAADRKDVEAMIDKLAKLPATLIVITTDASDPKSLDWKRAYVLVDGEIKIKAGTPPEKHGVRTGYAITVSGGLHYVDVVTPITHGRTRCHIDVGAESSCLVSAKPRIDGHLVTSSNDRDIHLRTESGGQDLVDKRVELPPGKQRLRVRDRMYHCAPITVDIPGGADVQYVYVGTSEYDFQRCRALTIKQQRLRF